MPLPSTLLLPPAPVLLLAPTCAVSVGQKTDCNSVVARGAGPLTHGDRIVAGGIRAKASVIATAYRNRMVAVRMRLRSPRPDRHQWLWHRRCLHWRNSPMRWNRGRPPRSRHQQTSRAHRLHSPRRRTPCCCRGAVAGISVEPARRVVGPAVVVGGPFIPVAVVGVRPVTTFVSVPLKDCTLVEPAEVIQVTPKRIVNPTQAGQRLTPRRRIDSYAYPNPPNATQRNRQLPRVRTFPHNYPPSASQLTSR